MPGNEWSSASNNTSRLFEQTDTYIFAAVPANGICFCESTLFSSPIAALGGHFLVESRAAGHRESYNGHKG